MRWSSNRELQNTMEAEFLCKQMFYLNISQLFWYVFFLIISLHEFCVLFNDIW